MTTRQGMTEKERREYWACLALRHCPGVGARTACRLLRIFGSAYEALQERQRWPEAGLTPKQSAALAGGAWRTSAREEWDRARDLDAAIVFWSSPAYPRMLRLLPDAPALLYCRGDLSLFSSACFAVVGARRATQHGQAVARHMARCLSACGISIVSGLALGIDRVAHQAALTRIGKSIGVLGTGIDVPYPQANRDIFEQMQTQGLLVSEWAPGTLPLPGNFPVRNRIISGLSLGVLVVEAAGRSGSLITARLALEQNREVFAVPGPALDARCLGSQDLVRQGARAVFNAEDVLRDLAENLRPYGISPENLPEGEDLPIPPGDTAADRPARPDPGASQKRKSTPGAAGHHPAPAMPATGAGPPIPEHGAALLERLREHGAEHVDVLAQGLGLSAGEANSLLVELEMWGLVRRLPGARYEVKA